MTPPGMSIRKELQRIVDGLPPGSSVNLPADWLREELEAEDIEVPTLQVETGGQVWTWAKILWLVPAERRLGTREVLEALGKGRTWLYRQMAENRGRDRLPHRKLDGQVLFTAGEVRAWVRALEVCDTGAGSGRFRSDGNQMDGSFGGESPPSCCEARSHAPTPIMV